jgi:hypothetical protein
MTEAGLRAGAAYRGQRATVDQRLPRGVSLRWNRQTVAGPPLIEDHLGVFGVIL